MLLKCLHHIVVLTAAALTGGCGCFDRFEGKLEGDPFHSSGFITAFSHLTVQQQGAFTLTARTFSGDLAELERTLADLDIDAAVYIPRPMSPSPSSATSPLVSVQAVLPVRKAQQPHWNTAARGFSLDAAVRHSKS